MYVKCISQRQKSSLLDEQMVPPIVSFGQFLVSEGSVSEVTF